ncbi:MAG: hypothetical protein IT314_12325 [Anaerolineales bacterium]|nr:hypothetical protein [Anaerolineales bacterium]
MTIDHRQSSTVYRLPLETMNPQPSPRLFPLLLKTTLLLVLFNFAFILTSGFPLGKLTLYNKVFLGRERFPFGENQRGYNLSLFDLDAMFAAHTLVGAPKADDEYRVLLIGDSSVWGTLLTPEQTLAGQLNENAINACGKNVHAYNLGYPYISLLQELMILDEALQYQPDMIVWLTTLESFPHDKQLTAPLVANSPERIKQLITNYQLPLNPDDPALNHPTTFDQAFANRRKDLANLIRLQLYGVPWSATGIDQFYPETYERAQTDFEPDDTFHEIKPTDSLSDHLAFEILDAGLHATTLPMILVNEPILISDGVNSDIRYNFFYPRWAYDQYRVILSEYTAQQNIPYLDLWDLVPNDEFTNSGVHLTPFGESLLADQVGDAIQNFCE